MDKQLLDYYTDYLITSTSQTTSTGLLRILSGEISHDKFTRFLNGGDYTSKELWGLVKPILREVEHEDGIVVFDDSVCKKPYTDQNELISWHYDHSKGRSVKGINLLTGMYVGKDDTSLPVVYDMVKKDILDEAGKSRSSKGKNGMMRECLDVVITNQIKFRWVITDIWFGSAENMNAIMGHGREFIMPLKNNRKVALSKEDKARGKYVPIGSLGLEPGTCLEVYMEKTPFP